MKTGSFVEGQMWVTVEPNLWRKPPNMWLYVFLLVSEVVSVSLHLVWTASPRVAAPRCVRDLWHWLTEPWWWPAASCSAPTWRNGRSDRGRSPARHSLASDDHRQLRLTREKQFTCWRSLKTVDSGPFVSWNMSYSSTSFWTHLVGIVRKSGCRLWTRLLPRLLTCWCSAEFCRQQNCQTVLKTQTEWLVMLCHGVMFKSTAGLQKLPVSFKTPGCSCRKRGKTQI